LLDVVRSSGGDDVSNETAIRSSNFG